MGGGGGEGGRAIYRRKGIKEQHMFGLKEGSARALQPTATALTCIAFIINVPKD